MITYPPSVRGNVSERVGENLVHMIRDHIWKRHANVANHSVLEARSHSLCLLVRLCLGLLAASLQSETADGAARALV